MPPTEGDRGCIRTNNYNHPVTRTQHIVGQVLDHSRRMVISLCGRATGQLLHSDGPTPVCKECLKAHSRRVASTTGNVYD